MSGHHSAERPFRFYDNRQKYLAFVTTCDEKWRVAERATRELDNLRPQPPAFRLFDAGVGDGTVLAHLLRAMHHRFPTVPFYVAGKEISLEDIRLTLDGSMQAVAEEALVGKKLDATSIAAAAKAGVKEARPLAQNGFKVQILETLIRRALGELSK